MLHTWIDVFVEEKNPYLLYTLYCLASANCRVANCHVFMRERMTEDAGACSDGQGSTEESANQNTDHKLEVQNEDL